MKAAVYRKETGLTVEDRAVPALQPGEALIYVKLAGICGTDIHLAEGKRKDAPDALIPGHEFMGVVAEVADTAHRGLVGRRVVAEPIINCGQCPTCLRGYAHVCEHLRVRGVHVDGVFAECAVVGVNRIHLVPDGLPDRLAAAVEPLAVAVHVVRRAHPNVGDSVMVIGAGPIGLLVAQVARRAGATRTVVVEVSPGRLAIARQLGFEVLDARDPAQQDTSLGMDIVFEVSGSVPGISRAIRSVRPRGTLLVVGFFPDPPPVELAQVLLKELELRGSRVYAAGDFPAAVALLEQGAIQAESLISHVLPLSQIKAAMDLCAGGTDAMKVLLDMRA
ncbi:MAG: alcohol dehydrogenase catalytic domain-containing protein [candidate division NC10 bacterium]|nr:alcohol dehydrogenase catalytic domain-containing protein [candidate division NC10 bacterium]